MLTTVLLVMFILDNEAHTFVVKPDPGTTCEQLLVKVPAVLPELIGRKPQAFAAACAEVKIVEIKV